MLKISPISNTEKPIDVDDFEINISPENTSFKSGSPITKAQPALIQMLIASKHKSEKEKTKRIEIDAASQFDLSKEKTKRFRMKCFKQVLVGGFGVGGFTMLIRIILLYYFG